MRPSASRAIVISRLPRSPLPAPFVTPTNHCPGRPAPCARCVRKSGMSVPRPNPQTEHVNRRSFTIRGNGVSSANPRSSNRMSVECWHSAPPQVTERPVRPMLHRWAMVGGVGGVVAGTSLPRLLYP